MFTKTTNIYEEMLILSQLVIDYQFIRELEGMNDLSDSLTLDGEWQFSLDNQSGVIQIPGCWESQGFPRRIDGPAIIERWFNLPEKWQGKSIILQFDALSYYVEVRLNSTLIGEHRGLWTRFEFDVTNDVRVGQQNHLHLTIYKPGNRFPLRESLAGFLPDVAVMFGGVWQSVRLIAHATLTISNLSILADSESGEVSISAKIQHESADNITLILEDANKLRVYQRLVSIFDSEVNVSVTIDNPRHWSPNAPHLYTTILESDSGFRLTKTFGFRKLGHDGKSLYLNNRGIFLRGVLNWGWYPEILCPAPDESTIRDEFRKVRALGFNLIKLCLFVPSPLYFEIADEEGMLIWLELPLWLPDVTDNLRQQAGQEYREILQEVHHHPSIIIYSLGCELDRAVDTDFMADLNDIVRGQSRGILLCDNSGSGEAYGGLTVDFSDFYDYHFYSELHLFDSLVDHFQRDWREARPWIFGEFCDADDFRDIDEIAEHYGGDYPWWLVEQNPIHPLGKIGYSLQEQRMRELDLPYDNQALMHISRQQSLVVRKAILEKVRQRSQMGGYVVTGLRDTPLATSSVYDDLGRAKYPLEAFTQFNNDTVLLIDTGRTRQWVNGGDRPTPSSPFILTNGQQTIINLIVSHAGDALDIKAIEWTVQNPDRTIIVTRHEVNHQIITDPTPQHLMSLNFDIPKSDSPQILTLSMAVYMTTKTVSNQWTLWCFPEIEQWQAGISVYDPMGTLPMLDDLYESTEPFTPSANLVITNCLTPQIQAYLEAGGHVLLLQQGTQPLPAIQVPFWRESVHLLQTDILPHHSHIDMQFYDIAPDIAFDMSRLHTVLPRAEDVTIMMRRLDARVFTLAEYLFGCQVGHGYLIATTLRLYGGIGDQPVSLKTNIVGRWVLYQLINHLRGLKSSGESAQ